MSNELFRIRIDRPDGTHVVSEAPTLDEAWAGLGCFDMHPHLNLISSAASVIHNTLRTLNDSLRMQERIQGGIYQPGLPTATPAVSSPAEHSKP